MADRARVVFNMHFDSCHEKTVDCAYCRVLWTMYIDLWRGEHLTLPMIMPQAPFSMPDGSATNK